MSHNTPKCRNAPSFLINLKVWTIAKENFKISWRRQVTIFGWVIFLLKQNNGWKFFNLLELIHNNKIKDSLFLIEAYSKQIFFTTDLYRWLHWKLRNYNSWLIFFINLNSFKHLFLKVIFVGCGTHDLEKRSCVTFSCGINQGPFLILRELTRVNLQHLASVGYNNYYYSKLNSIILGGIKIELLLL